MFKRFGQIFWGLLLVILDFRINHFDILPDIIGYILVAVGCAGLAGVSPRFATAGRLCWVLVVFEILRYGLRGGGWLLEFIGLVVNCAMMWHLLGGVMDLAAARQRTDLHQRASNRRIAYVVLMCFATLIGLVAQGWRDTAVLMVVLFIVCFIPLLVLILHLIYRVQHELADW